jgi:hypothetical protein
MKYLLVIVALASLVIGVRGLTDAVTVTGDIPYVDGGANCGRW